MKTSRRQVKSRVQKQSVKGKSMRGSKDDVWFWKSFDCLDAAEQRVVAAVLMYGKETRKNKFSVKELTAISLFVRRATK